jgi:predicted metal-dependent HD superfamily phosphohydrolase
VSDELEIRVAWERHLGRTAPANGWFERVVALHRSPGRHYHGVRHVQWVVRRVGALHERVVSGSTDVHPVDLPAVVAAAFFHDVVYEPTAGDNEARSADLADQALTEMGWAVERRSEVSTMIRATAAHDPGVSDLATALLIAADLSVLAADPAGYADYARNVRKEYAHVGDADWITGRGRVLRMFMERPSIFPTMLGLDDWERQARANITAELAGLSRGGSRGDEAGHEP